MNKYLLKGLGFTIVGIIAVAYSYQLKELENNWYKALMAFGVISFGYGFITLIYRLFRKIDRNSIVENRKKK